MDQKITLHSIFRRIINDPTFLLQTIYVDKDQTLTENDDTHIDNVESGQSKFDILKNMACAYEPLMIYTSQKYVLFPPIMKKILTPDYVRFGIKSTLERNSENINVSFLRSLNILLRPELIHQSPDDQINDLLALENFLSTSIKCNCQIDKIKNTKRNKEKNAELANNLTKGKITHDLIQSIVNIFEINLLVFDLISLECHFYWAYSKNYPFINLFDPVFCMTHIQSIYEPVISEKNATNHIYKKILLNFNKLTYQYTPNLGILNIPKLYDIDLSYDEIMYIFNVFFNYD